MRLVVPPLAGAAAYRFRAAADQDFREIVIDSVQRRPQVRIVNLRDGEYYFGVRGVDANGLQGQEALGRFKLARPPAPEVTDPSEPAAASETAAPATPESPAPARSPSPAATQ